MNTYHIVFKEKETDHMSKGLNFDESHPEIALLNFRMKFPNALFIAIYDLDAIIEIKGGAKKETVENIDNKLYHLDTKTAKVNLEESFDKIKEFDPLGQEQTR